MINKNQINIKMPDNKEIYSYIITDSEIKYDKAIVLVHGMAEHIDRYEEFINKLVANKFLVLCYNQRGHKFTSTKDEYGYMGECDNFNILVSDLNFMIDYIKANYNNLDVYLFGHSMGSFVSTRFSELYSEKIKALVLSGTGKNPNIALSLGSFFASCIMLFRGKKYRSKFIDSLAFGSYNKHFKPQRTPYDWLNQVDEEVDKYASDDWCGGIFTVKYYHDFFKGLIKVTNNIKKIRNDLPILFVSGSSDPVGNMGKGVKSVYDNLIKTNHTNINIKLYDNCRHEILLEKNKDEVMNDIITFLLNN